MERHPVAKESCSTGIRSAPPWENDSTRQAWQGPGTINPAECEILWTTVSNAAIFITPTSVRWWAANKGAFALS